MCIQDIVIAFYNLGNVFVKRGETLKLYHHLPNRENEIVQFICYNRDVRRGRGCATNTYMLLYQLCIEGYSDTAIKVFELLFPEAGGVAMQGCPKDYVRFLEYYSQKQGGELSCEIPIVAYCVAKILGWLDAPVANTMAKWIPREQTRWLFRVLAVSWYTKQRQLEMSPPYETKWLNRVFRQFRKHVSARSANIPCVERALCAREPIVPASVTRYARYKHGRALGSAFTNPTPELQLTAFQVAMHVNQHHQNIIYADAFPTTPARSNAGNNIMLGSFIKMLVGLIHRKREITGVLSKIKEYCDVKNRIYTLDLEWDAMVRSVSFTDLEMPCIPLLDNSNSMCFEMQTGRGNQGHAFYVSLGWACLIARLSLHRVLVMEQRPRWVILEPFSKLSTQIECIFREAPGMTSTSYINSMYVLRDAMHVCGGDMPAIVVLSNFQFSEYSPTLHEYTHKIFRSITYDDRSPPNPMMVYWNVGNTLHTVLPTADPNVSNCAVMSGEASGQIYNLNDVLRYPGRSITQHVLATLQTHAPRQEPTPPTS